MSITRNMSDQNTLASSSGDFGRNRVELNFFQKLDIISNELQGVQGRLNRLGEECKNIKQEKDSVEKYLQRKSEENRVRLTGELELFENQLNRKIQASRAETQKVDERINQMKQAQLYTLQMILSLQRRVQQLQVQLGVQDAVIE